MLYMQAIGKRIKESALTCPAKIPVIQLNQGLAFPKIERNKQEVNNSSGSQAIRQGQLHKNISNFKEEKSNNTNREYSDFISYDENSYLVLSKDLDSRFFISLGIADKVIFALLDSGSCKTYAGPMIAPLLGSLEYSRSRMTTANNKTVKVSGEKNIKFSIEKSTNEVRTNIVLDLNYNFILGLDFLEKFKFIIDFGNQSYKLPGGKWRQFSIPQGSNRQAIIRTSVNNDQIASLNSKDPRYFLEIIIRGIQVKALVDSGSTKTYLGKLFEKAFGNSLTPLDASIMTANNSTEAVLGEIGLVLAVGKMKRNIQARVVPNLGYDCILGMDFLKSFGFVIDFGKRVWRVVDGPSTSFSDLSYSNGEENAENCAGLKEISKKERAQICELVDRLVKEPEVIHRETNLTVHSIDVGDSKPIRQSPRRYSPKVLQAAQEAVDNLLVSGIIERAHSPWCSPPVLVPKSDGSYRFCIDFRKVNAVTKKHAHPLPNIDGILDRLRNARYISKIDMSQAFHQIPIDEKSRDITAFSVQGRGQFRYKRMPFGLTNASATYQEAMDQLIDKELPPEIKDVLFVYIDDYCLVTETFQDHVYWLEKVLMAIAKANLQVNKEKSEFCYRQVKYLGYIIDERGLHTDPDKVQAIHDFPAPTNVKQVKRFLGMVGWYARFLANLSKDKVPLCHLLKKNTKWHWGQEQQDAFDKLKQSLTTAPVLVRPDFSKRFYLQCDASDYAIGSVLTQEHDGQEHPIVFINRLLTAAERKWTTTEKECIAVLWAVQKLRPYLEGYPFTVITDHSSLKWLQNLKDPSGRLGRWAMKLLAHDITVVHRPGAMHHVPDALSRAYEDQVGSLMELDTKDQWYLGQLARVKQHPEKFPDWKISESKLFVHRPNEWINPLIKDLNAWKLVIPAEMRNKVLQETHDSPTAGHFGRDKTYKLLARSYYWPGMQIDSARYVKSCITCQRNKPLQSGPQGLMTEHIYDEPWSEICADIMGPLPSTKHQYRYLLVIQDMFTKYVICKPLRQAKGPAITKALKELVFYIFGCPKLVHTDNGTEFENNYLNNALKELGIAHTTIPPYDAQANPAERVNRSLKRLIRTYLKQNHKTWDENLLECTFAINNAEHESSKFSPFFLNFGRNPRVAGTYREQASTLTSSSNSRISQESWEDRISKLSAYHDLIKRYLSEASNRQAKYYNKGRKEVVFKVGDLVLKREHHLSKADSGFMAKLANPFSGPYRIKRVISPSVYDLELQNGRQSPKTHVRFLKRYEYEPI